MKELRNVDLMIGFSRKIGGDDSENFILNIRKSVSIIEQNLNECVNSETRKNKNIAAVKESMAMLGLTLHRKIRWVHKTFS